MRAMREARADGRSEPEVAVDVVVKKMLEEAAREPAAGSGAGRGRRAVDGGRTPERRVHPPAMGSEAEAPVVVVRTEARVEAEREG